MDSDGKSKRAVHIQGEIDRQHLIMGRCPLVLAPLYKTFRDEGLWRKLGYRDFEDWIDNYSQKRWRHGRSRVYDLIATHEKLSKSFDPVQMSLMTYENAWDIVATFGESVPERYRTVEFVRNASECSNEEFRSYLNGLAGGEWHLPDKPRPKTLQLTPQQHGTLKHAINKVKKEEGAETDAQAIDIMAMNEIKGDIKELPVDPIIALCRKIEAIEVTRSLKSPNVGPTKEQWLEVVAMVETVMGRVLEAAGVEKATA